MEKKNGLEADFVKRATSTNEGIPFLGFFHKPTQYTGPKTRTNLLQNKNRRSIFWRGGVKKIVI